MHLSKVDIAVHNELKKGRKVYLDYTVNPKGYCFDKLNEESKSYLEKNGVTGSTPIERLRQLNPKAIAVYANRNIDISKEKPTMDFFEYQSDALSVGAYGIREPEGVKPCPAESIDLMVVPAVAFTRHGERLGRGKGFYDCYLSREGFRAYTVGVCYSHQLLDSLPTEQHDCCVDEVVVGE